MKDTSRYLYYPVLCGHCLPSFQAEHQAPGLLVFLYGSFELLEKQQQQKKMFWLIFFHDGSEKKNFFFMAAEGRLLEIPKL